MRSAKRIHHAWKGGKPTALTIRGISNGEGPCVVRLGEIKKSYSIAQGSEQVIDLAELQ